MTCDRIYSSHLSLQVGDGRTGVILEDLPVEDLDILRLGQPLQVVEGCHKHLLRLLHVTNQSHAIVDLTNDRGLTLQMTPTGGQTC
jgi:hypothetical protein